MIAMAKKKGKGKPTNIKLTLCGDNKDKVIGIGEIARVLKGVQDTVFHLAEYKFTKGFYRTGGRRGSVLEKRTLLTFSEIEKGSFKGTIIGVDPQTTIYGETVVDTTIGLFGDMCNTLNYEDGDLEERICKIINSPLHRTRIIKDINDFWPGGDNKYTINLSTRNFDYAQLNIERKPQISSLTKRTKKVRGEKIHGILSMVKTHPKKEIEIRGSHGKFKCKYNHQLKRKIFDYALEDKPVMIVGEVNLDEAGNIKEMSNITNIKPLNNIPFETIITETGELQLGSPITATVDFKEGEWVLENDDLNIIAVGDYFDAIEQFQEDFYFLYETYYLGDSKKMGGNALKIKKYLKQYLRG